MKKILIFGHSIVDPKFFNTRVLRLKNTDDNYYFGKIISEATGIDDVKTFSISGCGNSWISSSIIKNLDLVDKDTLVIINWGFVDRYDLMLSSDNDHLQSELASCIDDRFKFLDFDKTFDFDGNEKTSGLRCWSTGHFMFGPKMKLKPFITQPLQLKDFYERVVMVQHLLKSKNCSQVHYMQLPPAHYTFRQLVQGLNSYLNQNVIEEPKYIKYKFQKEFENIHEENPELEYWKKLVDWNLFTEFMFEFYQKHDLPFICTDHFNNFHQTPISLYFYIKHCILDKLGLPQKNLYEEMIVATNDHCKKYNSVYDLEDPAVVALLSS